MTIGIEILIMTFGLIIYGVVFKMMYEVMEEYIFKFEFVDQIVTTGIFLFLCEMGLTLLAGGIYEFWPNIVCFILTRQAILLGYLLLNVLICGIGWGINRIFPKKENFEPFEPMEYY